MKMKFFSLLAASLALGVVACNNSSETTATTDSSTMTTDTSSTTGTASNMGNYAAMADSFRVNSEAGNYLHPRTGKPMRISMDVSSGRVTNAETGEPVWRYVDRRNWWVYGGENWDRLGEAKMERDRLMYRSDNDQWVDYETRWTTDDTKMQEDWKRKYGDTKVKVDSDGDIKVKTEKGKIKYDADDKKIKTDTSGR
jgi:hypothetical protein